MAYILCRNYDAYADDVFDYDIRNRVDVVLC